MMARKDDPLSAREQDSFRIPMDAPDGGTIAEDDELEPEDVRRIVHTVRRRGRPALSKSGRRSPVMQVRVPPETRQRLQRLADAQGRKTSDVMPAALGDYLRKHPAYTARGDSRLEALVHPGKRVARTATGGSCLSACSTACADSGGSWAGWSAISPRAQAKNSAAERTGLS